jgi:hypothetical protein
MSAPFLRRCARHNRSFFMAFLAVVLLALNTQIARAQQPQFDSISIDALDPDAWNGIVFLARAYQQPAYFALRVGSRGRSYESGSEIFNYVREIGPHAPDGSYARVGWEQQPRANLIHLEWARVDSNTAVGRLTAPPDIQLVLETYMPFSAPHMSQGRFALAESNQAIVGQRYFDGVFGHNAKFLVMVDQPTLGAGTFGHLEQIADAMNSTGRLTSRLAPLSAETLDATAGLEFDTSNAKAAHFVATIGWDAAPMKAIAKDWLTPGKIDALLDKNAAEYAIHRPTISGLFEGAPEAIGNNMFWSSIYAPGYNMIFPTDTRAWAHNYGGWMVFEWDNFFNAVLTSVEDKVQAADEVKATFLGQQTNGLIPNAYSPAVQTPDRSEPPVGAYLTWKVYEKYLDRAMLESAYPGLVKFHAFWFKDRGDGQPYRDGNRDGLLEWGSDKGSGGGFVDRGMFKAPKWESGMDDSPVFDDGGYDENTYTMKMDDIGLNSLYAVDAESLAKIAAILGDVGASRKYAAEYEQMKQRINAKLWNEKDGIYENRHWSGEFTHRISPTSFYPMLAGIATPAQAKRMVKEHLLNPNEFWGKYVIPTIARNDPAFPDQFYWRGSIWGPTNYLVYEGLKRYKFDATAFEVAQKSYYLFMDDWRTNQQNDEQYLAWGGRAKGDPHYAWGALLALMSTEEYIDENPWEGLRFGMLSPPSEGTYRGVVWENHKYDVMVGPQKTDLSRDGKVCFEANAGVVVRNYEASADGLSFTIGMDRETRVAINELAGADWHTNIDGKSAVVAMAPSGRIRFDLPPGEHTVRISK